MVFVELSRMSSRRSIVLNKKQELFECGATLLALLAFPRADDTKLAEIVASLRSEHLRAKFQQSGNPDERVKAKYAFRAAGTIKRDLRTFDRSIRDRMAAAHVAVAMLQKAVGHTPKLPASVTRLSLNQLSAFAMGTANQSNPENFETRVWRASLPVIHLAIGFGVAISNRERAGEARTGYGDLIADQEFISSVLTETIFAENVIKNNKLSINIQDLISIQIAGPE